MKCYRYEPSNDTWSVSGSFNYVHRLPAFTYHDELGLVILGGDYYHHASASYNNGSDQVESTIDGETIKVLSYIIYNSW